MINVSEDRTTGELEYWRIQYRLIAFPKRKSGKDIGVYDELDDAISQAYAHLELENDTANVVIRRESAIFDSYDKAKACKDVCNHANVSSPLITINR